MDDIATADPCFECAWQKHGCTCPILRPVIDEQAEQLKAKDEAIREIRDIIDKQFEQIKAKDEIFRDIIKNIRKDTTSVQWIETRAKQGLEEKL